MLTDWLIIVSACTLGALSPGPSLAVVLKQTLLGGRQAGLLTALAHGLGVGVYAALSIFGVGLIMTQSTPLFHLLSWIGAAYLLWLAAQAWHQANQPMPATTTSATAQPPIITGLVTALTNPKVMLFFMALFSQLIDVHSSVGVKLLYLVTAMTIDALWYILVAWMGSGNWMLTRLARYQSWINRGFALLLATIALRVILASIN